MNTGLHRPPFRLPLKLFLASLAVAVTVPLLAQLQQGFKGSGSKYPEYYALPKTGGIQTNRLRGMFFGTNWLHLSNKVFRVVGMRLEHYEMNGTTNLIAQAPECLFDTRERVAWSTGRLDIVGMAGALVLQGKRGFQVQMKTSTLIVSNRVRTVIQRELLDDSKP